MIIFSNLRRFLLLLERCLSLVDLVSCVFCLLYPEHLSRYHLFRVLSSYTHLSSHSPDEAWSFLRSLFSSQSTIHGFMPKFVYLNETYGDHPDNNIPEFVGPYPGPKLFKANEYAPDNENVWSSNTIMAPPYHATAILEVFYLSNQTNVDVNHLAFFYDKLRSWHTLLHKQVNTKCIEVEDASLSWESNQNHRYHPCVLVRHPWETEIDMQSPIWGASFGRLKRDVANSGWIPSLEVPDAVKSAYEYPGDDNYNSMLYLLQCLSNASNDDLKETPNSHEHIQSACPFSMIDVGFTAALAKSDQDLKQIQQILLDKNRISFSQRESDLAQSRIQTSNRMLHALWNENSGTFFNRIVALEPNTNGTYSSNITTEIAVAAAYNYNVLWAPLANATMVEHMTTQIVQHSGTFSFGCGDYAVWSIGGCAEIHHSWISTASPFIVPLLNYRIASGLKRNGASLEQYIQTSTLNLICGVPNSDESNLSNCSNIAFASAFNASTTQSISMNGCGLASTMAASVVLDIISADKPFRYESEPPISSSSVIVLIAIEMIIAMAIGLNCLILSLNLVRRANSDEEGDSFFRIDTDQRESMEQELLVQSPGLPETYDTSMAPLDDTYTRSGFEMLDWSLSYLNPLNLLRNVPVYTVQDNNQQKQ